MEESIHITEHDLTGLSGLRASPTLVGELEPAQVVPWELLPHDVVTMNARVLFEDESTGERREIAIVYPQDADASEGRVSVLAPVGTCSPRALRRPIHRMAFSRWKDSTAAGN
jgi:regulator of nucleoside diphosphate kinase